MIQDADLMFHHGNGRLSPYPQATLLDEISRHFGYPKPNRKGEHYVLCPFHDDRNVGSFSFSERGFCCFACGRQGSLQTLAEALGATHGRVNQKPMPRHTGHAKRHAERSYDWQTAPWRPDPLPQDAREYLHNREFTDASIRFWRIGYGMLPASRCKYPRILLPIFDEGKLMAIKGRAIHPDDHDAKWLMSAGSKPCLFGASLFEPQVLSPLHELIITEAPFSAMLAIQQTAGIVRAIANSIGATVWLPEWTQRIKDARPGRATVWYDNDAAGYLNGLKVVNELLEAGVRAQLFHWSGDWPPKADLADWLTQERKASA